MSLEELHRNMNGSESTSKISELSGQIAQLKGEIACLEQQEEAHKKELDKMKKHRLESYRWRMSQVEQLQMENAFLVSTMQAFSNNPASPSADSTGASDPSLASPTSSNPSELRVPKPLSPRGSVHHRKASAESFTLKRHIMRKVRVRYC